MATSNSFRTDLYSLHNYIQNTSITHPKEFIIELLRDFFSQDSYYHYVKDAWGFPKTPDLTDIPLDAGINDDVTTRLFIGEPFRYDVIYYPAILVKSGGSRSEPISFNNNIDTVQYTSTRYVDGYGNETFVSTPSYFQRAGAWEGSIAVDIETKSHRSRDELTELIKLFFFDTRRWELQNAGIFVRNVNVGAPSEADDRVDKLFKCTITVDIRSEWERRIPINNVIDAINICVEFGNLQLTPNKIAPNIEVNSRIELSESLSSL